MQLGSGETASLDTQGQTTGAKTAPVWSKRITEGQMPKIKNNTILSETAGTERSELTGSVENLILFPQRCNYNQGMATVRPAPLSTLQNIFSLTKAHFCFDLLYLGISTSCDMSTLCYNLHNYLEGKFNSFISDAHKS